MLSAWKRKPQAGEAPDLGSPCLDPASAHPRPHHRPPDHIIVPQSSGVPLPKNASLASCARCAVRGLSLALPSPPAPGEPIPPHPPPAEPPAHLLCASRGRTLPTPAAALVLVLGKLSRERPADLSSRVTAPGRPLLTPRRTQVPPTTAARNPPGTTWCCPLSKLWLFTVM